MSIAAIPRRRYAGATARQQMLLCPRENSMTPTISFSSFTQTACRLRMNLRTTARCSLSFSCVSSPGKPDRTCETRLIHLSISSGTPYQSCPAFRLRSLINVSSKCGLVNDVFFRESNVYRLAVVRATAHFSPTSCGVEKKTSPAIHILCISPLTRRRGHGSIRVRKDLFKSVQSCRQGVVRWDHGIFMPCCCALSGFAGQGFFVARMTERKCDNDLQSADHGRSRRGADACTHRPPDR